MHLKRLGTHREPSIAQAGPFREPASKVTEPTIGISDPILVIPVTDSLSSVRGSIMRNETQKAISIPEED